MGERENRGVMGACASHFTNQRALRSRKGERKTIAQSRRYNMKDADAYKANCCSVGKQDAIWETLHPVHMTQVLMRSMQPRKDDKKRKTRKKKKDTEKEITVRCDDGTIRGQARTRSRGRSKSRRGRRGEDYSRK